MGYDRLVRDAPPPSGRRRVAEDGTVPGAHFVLFRTHFAHEDGVRGQASNQPTANYPPENPPQWAAGNLDAHLLENGENAYGSASLCLPPSVTHLNPLNPTVEAHDARNRLDGEQEPHGSTIQMAHGVASPNRATPSVTISPEGVGQHPYTGAYERWRRSPHEWQNLGSSELSYMRYDTGESTGSACTAPHSLNGYPPIPGGGSRENQFLVANEHALIRTHSPGMYSHPTVIHNLFTSGGLPTEARGGRYDPHAEARPYHTQQRSDNIITLAGPSGERTDALRYTVFLDPHSHGDGGVRDGGHFAELPPDHRSDGLPSQPTGAQRHRNTRKTMQITGPEKAVPAPKRTRRRRNRGLKDPRTADLPVISAAAHTPSHVELIPQTPYRCTRQDGWIQQTPIRFGGVKVVDAADPGYCFHGHDEMVLNHEDVGSTISCRLNLNGKAIGKLKILTKNHKKDRQPITKKKLALEVAKLVEDYIEEIRTETGRQDVAFENIVLTKLSHVSKASWQPELWYEVPAPDSDSSHRPGPSSAQ